MPAENQETDKGLEGYRGLALQLLNKYHARVGQRVSVSTEDGFVAEGLLIPRYEHADTEHIVVKLKSGYNIGIDTKSVKSLSVLGEGSSSADGYLIPPHAKSIRTGARRVLLLSTGGTIASRIDYRTGAVHPALSAEDLKTAIPELEDVAEVEPEVVFSMYSENIDPSHWEKLSKRIVQQTKGNEISGVVVMIGTDTLAYVSAALSFSLIGFAKPVVCVGSQRSSDRPSSDSALNLKAAVQVAANFSRPGVYVAMHASENDDDIAIHHGTRVRKNHTSRRDAFRSIDTNYAAIVREEEIREVSAIRPEIDQKLLRQSSLRTEFEKDVSLVKFHPGFDSEILNFLVSQRGVKGIILEGTGLGHVSQATVSKIEKLTKEKIFVGMTSQCIWGHVDLNVYDTGRDLIQANVVPLGNMLGETAFAKLSWVLGNFSMENWVELMQADLVGEQGSRLFLK